MFSLPSAVTPTAQDALRDALMLFFPFPTGCNPKRAERVQKYRDGSACLKQTPDEVSIPRGMFVCNACSGMHARSIPCSSGLNVALLVLHKALRS